MLASSATPPPSPPNDTSIGDGYSARKPHGANTAPATRKIAKYLFAFIRLRLPSRTSVRLPDLVCARATLALQKDFRWYSCPCALDQNPPPSAADRSQSPPAPAPAGPVPQPPPDRLPCLRSPGTAGSKPATPAHLSAPVNSPPCPLDRRDSTAPADAP